MAAKHKLVEAVIRVLSIIVDLTRTGGETRSALAQRYGVSLRTILRDFDLLQSVGVPIDEEPDVEGKEKRWHISFSAHMEKLARLLSTGHYLAFRLAVGSSVMMRSVGPLFSFIEDLSDKMAQVLGPKMRQQLAQIEACFFWYEKGVWTQQPPQIFWPLIDAIIHERVCFVDHKAARPDAVWNELKILPLKFFVHDGAMYLMHWSFKYGNIGVINMHRVRGIRVTDEHMAKPKDFDPAKYEGASFGVFGIGAQVAFDLIFNRQMSCFIRERTWVGTQQLFELAGDEVQMKFSCADSPEVLAFILRWTTGVIVQGPQSIRDQLYQFGLWLVKTYGPQEKQGAPDEKVGSPSQHDVVT